MKSEIPVNTSIFREYDIRGIADKDFDAGFAYNLGRAYASLALSRVKPTSTRGKLRVSVGRDCRLTGEKYAQALTQGLVDSGIDVTMLGVCPTPLTYFSIFHLSLDGGIMVTGSHNPSDYNGFKICLGKDTLHGSDIQELRKRVEGLKSLEATSKGEVQTYSIIPPYIEHLATSARVARPLKVVLDAGNGTAGNVAPPLFKRIGAQVTELYCDLDGTFPNHHPDPTVPENLKDLVHSVRSTGADLGLAFDGDSDRIGVVDEKGRIIFGDELLIVLAREVLKDNPGTTIISEVKSSHRLYQDIAKHGGKPLMWKTGHSLIKSKMKETGAALAGEMSGHIFFADRYFGYDDAIYAALRVYEIASKYQGPFSDLLKDVPPMVATPEIRIDCSEELKFQLVTKTKERLAAKFKINDIDGVRVDFGDSWGLVRASNTQPVLVLRFEAPNESRMVEIRKIVEGALQESARELGHAPILE